MVHKNTIECWLEFVEQSEIHKKSTKIHLSPPPNVFSLRWYVTVETIVCHCLFSKFVILSNFGFQKAKKVHRSWKHKSMFENLQKISYLSIYFSYSRIAWNPPNSLWFVSMYFVLYFGLSKYKWFAKIKKQKHMWRLAKTNYFR